MRAIVFPSDACENEHTCEETRIKHRMPGCKEGLECRKQVIVRPAIDKEPYSEKQSAEGVQPLETPVPISGSHGK